MIFLRTVFVVTLFTLSAFFTYAQDRPIGYWRSHLPYNSGVGIATDGSNLFAITTKAFFTQKGLESNVSPIPYSKVEGMADVGMQCVAYDKATATTVLVYSNGNIDLFKEKDGTFYNIPDFKIKNISGTKSVSGVFAENGVAYISTSIGILVIDLANHVVVETYDFVSNNTTIPISGFTRNGSYFYAITTHGVYSAATNNPQLQNFQVWGILDTTRTFKYIASVNNQLYMANEHAIYTLINDTLHMVYAADTTRIISHIDAGLTGLLVCEYIVGTFRGDVKIMNSSYVIADTFNREIFNPLQAVQLMDSMLWVADGTLGLYQIRIGTGTTNIQIPAGPSNAGCFDIYAHNKNVWVAHGGLTDDLFAIPSYAGLSNFNGDKWKAYKQYAYPPLNDLDDFTALAKDETNGTTYMGSFLNGLFILKQDGSYEAVNANSIFDTSKVYFGNNQRQIGGLALDQSNNLWVTTIASYHQLYAKTENGWYKFVVPGDNILGGPVVVDDNGQVWWGALGGGGVVVYDPAGTIEDASDDHYYQLTTGSGTGNLPSNKVFCIAKDKNNNIWVGTDNGIGIISNCHAPGPCDGQLPIVQYDQFAGYLFAGNNVRSIAVDGGNRKWVGTDDGIWLLSSDAQQIVYRFTEDNSPLPSNHIRKISIDKVTGDVYIGTDNGLVSYRSTATDEGTTTKNVEVFPNPVTHDYMGTIAIKGLAANSDVRITDVTGQLVYKTKANGGEAVWNGKDYKGHKPQSGVYLVFASSSDGTQTYSGKIVFIQ